MKVRVFDDAKYLSTNESTIIEAKGDMQDVNLTSDDIKDNIIEGECIAVQIKKEQSCVICNNTLEVPTDEDTVTCKSCNVTMLSTTCNPKLVCNVTIKTPNGKFQSYTCFNDAIQSFLASIDNNTNLDDIPHDELQSLMLHAGTKQMIVDDSSKVIYQFLL